MLGVGEFVRFKWDIVRGNPGVALTGDHGIVVAVDREDKTVLVAWPDGQQFQHPAKVLERTTGTIARAARSVGEKRRPAADKGRRPVQATPAKPAPAKGGAATWVVGEPKASKGFVLDPTPKRPDGGFMRFKTPHTVVAVRAAHWGENIAPITLRRSDKSLTVTFPNGEKASHTPTGGRAWLLGKFGPDTGETLCGKLRV